MKLHTCLTMMPDMMPDQKRSSVGLAGLVVASQCIQITRRTQPDQYQLRQLLCKNIYRFGSYHVIAHRHRSLAKANDILFRLMSEFIFYGWWKKVL